MPQGDGKVSGPNGGAKSGPLRIAVVGINFHPEQVGIGVYTHDMCRYFAEAGHDVVAVTGFPFYPDLRPHAGYAGRWFMDERIDGITVRRCYTYIPGDWKPRSRVLHELSFALSSLPRLALMRRPDVLIAVLPPLGTAVLAGVIARCRGIPFLLHVQDLQTAAAAELGLIRRPWLLRALRAAERAVVRRARLVSTLDEGMRDRIVRLGAPPERVAIFPNWIDVDAMHPVDPDGFRRTHGLDGKFLVVYAGTMGLKHGLEHVIDVAGAADDATVQFVLIGDGPVRPRLESETLARGLRNVSFLPLQPLERFPSVIAASDLSIVPQRPEVRDLVAPSKLLRIMAGGSPVVAVAHPESGVAKMVDASGGGVVIGNGSPAATWAAIRELKAAPDRRACMGAAGRRHIARHYGRRLVLGRYLDELARLARGSGSRTVLQA